MTDLVERLRDDLDMLSSSQMHALGREAADEIEQLRAALDEVKAELLQVYERQWASEADEIEKLRAQVDGASSPGANWYHSYTEEIEKLRAQVVALRSSLEVGKREGKKTP